MDHIQPMGCYFSYSCICRLMATDSLVMALITITCDIETYLRVNRYVVGILFIRAQESSNILMAQ